MPKEPNTTPATMSGRVLQRLDQIESWFRDGLKTKQVHALLAKEGIKIHPVNLSNLLGRYGKSEKLVRKAMEIEAATALPEAPEAPLLPVAAPALTNSKKTASVQANNNGKNKPPKTAGKEETRSRATEALKRKEQGRVEFRHDPSPPSKDSLV